MNQSTKNCLILSDTPYFGSSRFVDVINSEIDLTDLINNPLKYKNKLLLRAESISYLQQQKYLDNLDKTAKWLDGANNHIVSYFDDNYPSFLKQISNPPMLLYCIGDIGLLCTDQIAVVGARNNSTYGKNVAKKIITELATVSNVAITSGLAYGIDTLAHHYALESNLKTIAVMGTGIDIIYPSSNRSLYHKIAREGLIVSEYGFGVKPLRHNFPQRNRIISALSKGVLVIEASSKSGSLITADLALEQNKEVFAIPGSIFNSASLGCNELIKQGAKLVNNANDIIEEFSLNSTNKPFAEDCSADLDDKEKVIFDCINSTLTTVDQIVNQSNLSYDEVTNVLFELEMKSLVESVVGGYVRY